jgi:hypothetical protein
MLDVKIFCNNEAEDGVPEEFKAFVGPPGLIKLGGIGPMKERLDKQAPIFRTEADHFLESRDINVLPNRFGKFLPGVEAVLPFIPAAVEQAEDGFHNVAHIRFRLFGRPVTGGTS